jgi:hypothetical protein
VLGGVLISPIITGLGVIAILIFSRSIFLYAFVGRDDNLIHEKAKITNRKL